MRLSFSFNSSFLFLFFLRIDRGILALLNGDEPQVTFSCKRDSSQCDFQFWISEKESFYCELNGCAFHEGK